MRSCDVLTEGLLKAALRRRRLPAEQRAVLTRHLGEPCEACLDLLERWTTEEMITELYGSEDLLSWGEQERVFAVASAGGPSGGATLRVVRPDRQRRPRLTWGVGVAAIALVVLVTVTRPDLRDPAEGLKGAQRPTVALVPFVGARTPTPHVIRALASGKPVVRGEVLLLRIRLDAPAWIYLLSQRQGESTELVWPMGVATRHASGEFELAEAGAALAIDPEALGTGARLIVIASPERIDAGRLRIQGQLHTRAEVEEAFPGCGVDLLPVILELER